MTKISAVIPTLDEEENLEDCIKSLKWVDEIIVVDGGSSDNTIDVAEDYGAIVLEDVETGENEGFDSVRNKGIDKATNEWILRVDADELIPKSLAQKLQELAEENEYDIIEVPRLNHFLGEEVTSRNGWPDYQKILFRKDSMSFSEEPHNIYDVEEGAETYRIEPDKNLALRHFSHIGLKDQIDAMNRYTSIEACEDYSDPSILLKPIKKLLVSLFYGKGIFSRKGRILSVLDAEYVLNRELKKAQLKYFGSDQEIEKEYSAIKDQIVEGLNEEK